MQMNSRNNGNRARGQRIMTTIKMNARDAAEWRIKLIILLFDLCFSILMILFINRQLTYLEYCFFFGFSFNIFPNVLSCICLYNRIFFHIFLLYPFIWDNAADVKRHLPGALPAPGSHLHSPRSVDTGQWRLQWRTWCERDTRFSANGDLTGYDKEQWRSRTTCDYVKMLLAPLEISPCPTGKTVTYRYFSWDLGCSMHFSRFASHGAWIVANGEWSSPLMESSLTADPEYI